MGALQEVESESESRGGSGERPVSGSTQLSGGSGHVRPWDPPLSNPSCHGGAARGGRSKSHTWGGEAERALNGPTPCSPARTKPPHRGVSLPDLQSERLAILRLAQASAHNPHPWRPRLFRLTEKSSHLGTAREHKTSVPSSL